MKAKSIHITRDLLLELLRYEPETGKLYWRERSEHLFEETASMTAAHNMRRWNSTFAGKEAFANATTHGYARSTIFGSHYAKHRIIWLMVTGEQPEQIDHINGDPSDNRFSNLRAVCKSQNMRNIRLRKDNSSGHVGVSRASKGNSWEVMLAGRYLGSFPTKEEAIAARKAAEAEQGFSRRHGIKA